MAKGDGRVFQRFNMWWCAYSVDGKEYRESTGETDEQAARKFLRDRIKHVSAHQIGAKRFVKPLSKRYTVKDLVEQLRENYKIRDKLSEQSAGHLDRVVRDFGNERAMTLIEDSQRIDKYIIARKDKGDAPASINRTLQLLNQSFKLAVKKKQLNETPVITRLTVENVRKQFIEEDQLTTLISLLPNDGLADFIDWLGWTGQRRGEASLLTWNMVRGEGDDAELEIPGDICKNGHARTIPLTPELAAIIERRRKARSIKLEDGSTKIVDYIFHRGGQRIVLFRKSWARAVRAAGFPDLVPHDLRRVAARRLIKSGIPVSIARKVTGHETDSMFHRYGIIESDDVREAMEQAAAFRKDREKKAAEKAAAKKKVVAMGG